MSRQEHEVEKSIDRYELRKALSDYMESRGYNSSDPHTQIDVVFMDGSSKVGISKAVFKVEDPKNPAPVKVKISKKEATAIIAKAKKIDMDTHDIEIGSY